jgi:alpha-tubulin suppressor-like RCC1 family protein
MNPLRSLAAVLLSLPLFVASLRAAGTTPSVVEAVFATATTVPVTAVSYTATGNTVNLGLNFAPPAGTNLTVVNNTGLAFIQGTFDNLEQGQTVTLTYDGASYRLVANYFGGTGNDLVLQWAGVRLLAWGSNSYGQLGNGRTSDSWIPTGVENTGVLAGKTVVAFSGGFRSSLALCADGTLVAWGYNGVGNLGNGNTTSSTVPVAVDRSGVLTGKTVIAIDAGTSHSVVLCSDGTLATWGWNTSGELGSGSSANTTVPVLVNRAGALLGKSVVAVAAGANHCLALCSDGKMVTWGSNYAGQLGIGSYTTTGITTSNVPVAVNTAGVLAGKTVTAISVGYNHNLALCSDGSVVAWGQNSAGQLGNNSTSESPLPTLTDRTGVLAGKSVTAISAGSYHSLALCADGTVVSWGGNARGELGNAVAGNSNVPVLVDRSGVLAGKTVVGIAGAYTSSMARCADGTIATWGDNQVGQLGNNSTAQSSVPVELDASELRGTERFVSGCFGSTSSHGLVLMSAPPLPAATTLAAVNVTDTGATLQGTTNANGSAIAVTFEYGLTAAYGAVAAATPGVVTGTVTTEVTATLANLLSNATYHYRLIASGTGGTAKSDDMTFTTSAFAALSGLTLSGGSLVPAFSSTLREYGAVVPAATDRISVTPVAAVGTATVAVNGTAVPSGSASAPMPLANGPNPVVITVVAADGINIQNYVVTVTRLPAMVRFESAATAPVRVPELTATGNRISLELGFSPPTGTDLTVVDNTGLKPIQGTFDGLSQGQRVVLGFGGLSYEFVANYFGGTGNDLVLQWARNRLVGWGAGIGLGNSGNASSLLPTAVDMTGVLAGKTVIGAAAGGSHSLVVCADGTVAAWGSNLNGRLGDGTTTNRSTPVLVNRAGALAGKTVVSVAAGASHSLALCSDGTLAAWGGNDGRQLGVSSTSDSSVPVLVDRTGVLAGRTVTAIAAGKSFNLALCEDGRVAAWGFGFYGELGNGVSVMNSWRPVWVDQSGALAGRRVSAIAAGIGHGLALCTDGTLVAWGQGSSGELGNNRGDTNSLVPSLVDQSGVLAGRGIQAISAGGNSCNVLCADGRVAGWGGNGTKVPTLVPIGSALQGRTVIRVAAGSIHRLAVCADGPLTAWGLNYNGQLGDGTNTNSLIPVPVGQGDIRVEERLVAVASGSVALHNLAWVAAPVAPAATTWAATAVLPTSATLQGQVNAGGGSVVVTFEYGLSSGYGTTVAGSPSPVGGAVPTAVSGAITGLSAGAVYHFRVIATGPDGTAYGADQIFTASNPPAFGGYSIATPWQTASNIPLRKLLTKASDPDGDTFTVTAAGPASANGGTVALLADSIRYMPPNNFSGVDTFQLTLTDAGGASVTGTINVTVGPAPNAGGMGANPPTLTTLPDGKMAIAFYGIPGRSYIVQRSVSGLDNWVTLATIPADASGKVAYTDESPPAGSAFYRLGLP